MVKSGMVDVVDCPEDVEVILKDYDCPGCVNDDNDILYDDDGTYVLVQLN
jgi:hypothetical protein